MAVMNTKKTGLVALLVLAIAVDLGSALKCWSCSSSSDRACHDPFNRSHMTLIDCDVSRSQSSYSSYSRPVCKKMKQRVSGGDLITIRQCDWVSDLNSDSRDSYNRDSTSSNACASTSAQSYVKVEYCETCSQDGCNGSMSHIAASAWTAFIPIIVYFGYKKSL